MGSQSLNVLLLYWKPSCALFDRAYGIQVYKRALLTFPKLQAAEASGCRLALLITLAGLRHMASNLVLTWRMHQRHTSSQYHRIILQTGWPLAWQLPRRAHCRGSAATAVAVWVRVLLPQIIGCDSLEASRPALPIKSSAAAAPAGTASSAAAAAPADASQLSAASTEKAFAYLDGLLRAPDVKCSISSGVAACGTDMLPLVPPSAVIAIAKVHRAA